MNQKVIKKTYNQIKSEHERHYYQRSIYAFDHLFDSIYLAESVLSYFEDITGDEFDFNQAECFYPSLSLFIAFGILGFLRGTSEFKTNHSINQCHKQLRTALSGIKNGRHAVVNISNLVGIFSHQAIGSNLFSPAGAVGFGVGILLAANNIYKAKLDEKRNHNAKKIEQYLLYSNAHFLEIKPPNIKDNQKRILTSVIHGLTDGLYTAGNIMMLCSLAGVSMSFFPVGVGFSVFLGLYTIGSMIQQYFKEKELQLKEELQFLEFLKKLDAEGKLEAYHNQYKTNRDYQKYLKFNLTDGFSIDFLRKKIKDKEIQINEKKQKYEKNFFYQIYKRINRGFSNIRDYVNCIKNSLSVAVGIDVLISRHPMAEATKNLGCIIAGLSIALPFFIYKTYRLLKPKHKPIKLIENNTLPDLLSFFESYNKNSYFKLHHHQKFINDLIEKHKNNPKNAFRIYSDLNRYVKTNNIKINKNGTFYHQYLAIEALLKKQFNDFSYGISYLYKQEYINYYEQAIQSDHIPKHEYPTKQIKALLSLFPKVKKDELFETLLKYFTKDSPQINQCICIFFKLNMIDSLEDTFIILNVRFILDNKLVFKVINENLKEILPSYFKTNEAVLSKFKEILIYVENHLSVKDETNKRDFYYLLIKSWVETNDLSAPVSLIKKQKKNEEIPQIFFEKSITNYNLNYIANRVA